jgi:site-specific DNA-methyltransferase (adenine-specific)
MPDPGLDPLTESDGVTIYCGDCHDILPTLNLTPDLVLTDPPYGIDFRGTNRPGNLPVDPIAGDDEPFDPRWMLDYGRCVIFGANYFAHLLPPGGWIIWSKAQDNRWADNTRSLAEVAWTNCHRYVALWNCFWAGSPLYRAHERGTQLHPTQKPLSLMRWIIGQNTKPGDLVLDPYMGSGPVARACADLGRRYVGIEIEQRYCDVAAQRLMQGALDFGGVA